MVASSTSLEHPFEWALRLCQSLAFFFHGILGMTEPFTGCLRATFKDNGAMPSWFWPVAGMILWVVAAANFSSNDSIVLAAQAYIASFHMGGFFYHLRLGHHPIIGCAPAVFAVFAFIITSIRTNLIVGAIGFVVCTFIAFLLSRVLVKPPVEEDGQNSRLLRDR